MKLKVETEFDEPAINLTPMIDVVFQLLVYFMLATTFLDPEKNLEVELPRATAGTDAREASKELIINVRRDGHMEVGGRMLEIAALQSELAQAAQRDPRTPVTIRGDRLVTHETIVRVLDACKGAGLSNLSLGTLAGS